jgi:putative endopeptidase
MPRYVLYAVVMAAVTACSTGNRAAGVASPAPHDALLSGVETQYIDDTVRPEDDIYRHLNGKWLDTFQIPADKGSYGAFTHIDDETQEQLRSIVEGLAGSSAGGQPTGAALKLADLYASFMDEPRLETLGLAPLKGWFADIDALTAKREIPALIARFNRTGAGAPYGIDISSDPKESTRYAASMSQSGLGLPDRDYYLKDDAKLKEARGKYLAHIEKMLGMAGEPHAR